MLLSFLAVAFFACFLAVNAEMHTVKFDNQCGHGTPVLIHAGKLVSNGSDYTASGPISGISYLQTGECLYNGEGCALVEMTLVNSACIGCGSSSDISLIPPHTLNVPTKFEYFNGCNGEGATCADNSCSTAFRVPDDNIVQVQCQEDDVNLLITFCDDSSIKTAQPSSTANYLPTVTSKAEIVTPTSTPAAATVAVYDCGVDRRHARDFA